MALAILLAACSTEPPRSPAIGEAYAGPAQLKLRQEISPRSAIVASVPHGEKLAIVQQRRRFYKVRTPSGAEGWTDERMLLSAAEVATLASLAEATKSAPAQAVATVFEDLNVHSEPYRTAPSFYQIKANDKVDVIGRRATTRSAQTVRKILVTPSAPRKKKAAAKEKEKKKTEAKLPPPPMPPAPKLPPDWLELSQRSRSEEPPAPARPAEPEPVDDWSLVRARDGQCGWVLTRRLYMAIPDEVAQYAEGHRIRAYFPIGQVHDRDVVKNNWLWATVDKASAAWDFDSIRVFTWNTRRHRYETSYIERNLKGYYPIRVDTGKPLTFSIVVDKKDGTRVRRRYTMPETRVRSAGEEPVNAGAAPEEPETRPSLVTHAAEPAAGTIRTWWENLRRRFSK